MLVLTADGLEIYSESHGSKSAPYGTIILIRGLGSQLIQWPNSFLTGLQARDLHVICLDNRDSGLSSTCDKAYTLDDMAHDTLEVLNHFGIHRAHILGISLGGMVCQRFCAMFPHRVLTCIPVMTTASGQSHLAPESSNQVFMPPATDDAGRIKVIFQSLLWNDCPGFPSEVVHLKKLAEHMYARAFEPEGERRQWKALINTPPWISDNSLITAPALVIHGADDRLLLPSGGKEVFDSLVNAGRGNINHRRLLVIKGMGHSISEGLGDKLAAECHSFIVESHGDFSKL